MGISLMLRARWSMSQQELSYGVTDTAETAMKRQYFNPKSVAMLPLAYDPN